LGDYLFARTTQAHATGLGYDSFLLLQASAERLKQAAKLLENRKNDGESHVPWRPASALTALAWPI
jgi:hypothetical protein